MTGQDSGRARGELLIIQKEFDGFADMQERLDVVALDKRRRPVATENKLDDTGRDVVRQGLEYGAFCSTLTKAEIVRIFQECPASWSGGVDARTSTCEFLKEPDLEDVALDQGTDPRSVMVAGDSRKEVAATVLRLLERSVNVQCFRTVPSKHDNDVLVDLRQLIPRPEFAEYMITLPKKIAEEGSDQDAMRRGHALPLEFWTKALEDSGSRA